MVHRVSDIRIAHIEQLSVNEASAMRIPEDLKGTELVCFVGLHPG
ncbi:MAG: hypothetical protein VX764_02430 [Planctomycetota bacterium]|nr:hypothetical protein [Planctomycetota bacterium]